MKNPWASFATMAGPPYVLLDDVRNVDLYNEKLGRSQQYKLRTEFIPEPWLGPVESATLVILQLNPRYDKVASNESAKLRIIGKLSEPHYGLRENARNENDVWWLNCLKQIATIVGNDLKPDSPYSDQLVAGYAHLRTRVCSLEYVPYGSKNFGHGNLKLPSQAFSFDLVTRAIERRAHVVVMKGKDLWFNAVPALRKHDVTIARGRRGAMYLTPYSCGKDFCKIVRSCCDLVC